MKPLKLTAREFPSQHTIVEIDGPRGKVRIGEGSCTMIAGPCAAENREEYLLIAQTLKEMGVHILCGGLSIPAPLPILSWAWDWRVCRYWPKPAN